MSIACISFQDSQNGTFLQQAGVYSLVPKDLWQEILCFSYGIYFLLPFLATFSFPWMLQNARLLFSMYFHY